MEHLHNQSYFLEKETNCLVTKVKSSVITSQEVNLE